MSPGWNHSTYCKCRLCNIPKGENNWLWRGQRVTYSAVHAWIERLLGKPSLCSNCGSKDAKKYEWANISGKYLRKPEDWKRLCTKCHIKMDGRNVSRFGNETRHNIRRERDSGVRVSDLMRKYRISKTHFYRIIKEDSWY